MASAIPNDIDVDEVFFDSSCININPSDITKKIAIQNKDQLSILNINIRSLAKNFTMLLTLLKMSKINYSIIIITETWLKDSDDGLFNIPGYNHISLCRKGSDLGGGLRLYYRQSIKLIALDNKLTGIHDSHECLSCDFNMNNKYNLKIIGLYRPPKNNINSFIQHIKNNGLAQNSADPNFIKVIAGDMNIPYCPNNFTSPRSHKEYSELFVSKAFRFHITKPTRIGTRGNRDSIIDHIWSNCFSNSTSFTINYKMSDHLPTAVILDYKVYTEPQTSTFYDFSMKNMINFIGQKHVAFKPLLEYDIKSMNVSTNHIFNGLMNMAKKYFPIRKKNQQPRVLRHLG